MIFSQVATKNNITARYVVVDNEAQGTGESTTFEWGGDGKQNCKQRHDVWHLSDVWTQYPLEMQDWLTSRE